MHVHLPQLTSSSPLSQSFSPSHFQKMGIHWVEPAPQLNSFTRHVLMSAWTKTQNTPWTMYCFIFVPFSVFHVNVLSICGALHFNKTNLSLVPQNGVAKNVKNNCHHLFWSRLVLFFSSLCQELITQIHVALQTLLSPPHHFVWECLSVCCCGATLFQAEFQAQASLHQSEKDKVSEK